MPFGAFLRRILFNAPGTAEPSEYSPAELVVYEIELMTETYRLEPGTYWWNQWTGTRCKVIKVEDYTVTVELLTPPYGEKFFPNQEAFLEAYVIDPNADNPRCET